MATRTVEISEETYQKLKDQLLKDNDFKEISCLEDLVGGKFFFRTLTYHMTGKVKKIIGKIVELEDAAWIADSGRFMNAIKNGTLNEVEPVGKAFINIESVTDFFPWVHVLPTNQK